MTRPGLFLLAVLALAIAGVVASPAGAAGPYGPGYRDCGTFEAGYKIHVYASHTSCRQARRVQKEYWLGPDRRKRFVNGGYGANGHILLKRFPGWRCTSGSGGGQCAKGGKVAAYQN